MSWTLGLTSLAYFMVALDSLVVVTALPAIDKSLSASASSLQWTINAYGLTWAACMITAAALGDRYGRRRMLIVGLALFTGASAVCAVAPNIWVLVGARAVQGIGAATVLPLSLTILAGVFPAERRGAIVGIWGGIGGLAIASGPLVGGALTQGLSWHWVFWLNVPIGIVVGVLAATRLRESKGPVAKLDLPGVVLITGAAAMLIWSLVRGSDVGWGSGEVIGGLVLGVVLLGAFIAWEHRAPQPMLPLRLFRSPSFAAVNVTAFAMNAALLSAGVYASQYFQFVHGDSPFAAGARLLPMMAMPLIVAPVAGLLSDRVGPRPLIVTGLLVEAVGLFWFARTADPTTGYLLLVVPLVMTGVGLAMAQTTVPSAALGAVPQADMGKASGINGTLQRFGGAFGVAVTTATFAANGKLGTPQSVSAGLRPAMAVAGVFAVLGALAALGIRTAKRRAAAPAATPAPVATPAAAGADR